MSKILDAVRKAEGDREGRSIAAPDTSVGQTTRVYVLDPVSGEGRWVNGAAPAVSASNGSNGPTPMSDSSMPTPSTWEQTLTSVQRELEDAEQDAARCAQEQGRLKAEISACDHTIATLTQQRETLHQQVARSIEAAATLEATTASWRRKLEALRECQVLSHTLRRTEQDLLANTALVAHVTQAQQQVAEELAQHRQRGEALQRQVQELRFRLAQALTSTGTTDPTNGAHNTRGVHE